MSLQPLRDLLKPFPFFLRGELTGFASGISFSLSHGNGISCRGVILLFTCGCMQIAATVRARSHESRVRLSFIPRHALQMLSNSAKVHLQKSSCDMPMQPTAIPKSSWTPAGVFFFSPEASASGAASSFMASLHCVMSSGVRLSAKSMRDMSNCRPSRFAADATQHHR